MDFALAFIVRSTLILFISLGLLAGFKKRSAAFRHWFISVSMLVLLILPFLIYSLPQLKVKILPARPIPAAETTSVPQTTLPSRPAVVLPPADREPQIWELPDGYAGEQATATLEKEEVTATTIPWSLGQLLFAVWLLGFTLMLLRVAAGLYRLQLRKKEASAVVGESFLTGGEWGDIKKPEVYSHPGIRTPMTWNARRPIILLPAEMLSWDPEALKIVFMHELMHIRRRDFHLHLFGLLVSAVYWFHPLQWWLNRRYTLEREKACDEAVIHSGVDKVNYAEQLLNIAKKLASPSGVDLALQMAQPSTVKRRILAILSTRSQPKKIHPGQRYALLIIALAALPLLAAVKPDELPVIDRFPILQSVINASGTEPEVNEPDRSEDLILTENMTGNTEKEQALIKADQQEKLRENSHLTIGVLPTLSSRQPAPVHKAAPDALEFQPIKVSQQQRLYGQWQNGKSRFKVWVKGRFDLYPTEPYVVAQTAEDMIVVEEQRGRKTYKLVISRAPYHGGLIQSYLHGKPNSWSGIPQGENLYLWVVNGNWKFLAKGLDNWMQEQLKEVSIKLEKLEPTVFRPVHSGDELWEKFMDAQELLREERFRKLDELPRYDVATDRLENTQTPVLPLLPLDDLPVRPPYRSGQPPEKQQKRIGVDRPSRVTSGWSGGQGRGLRYGVLIDGQGLSGQLNSFNFHLRHNLCRNATLQLHFYEVQDGKPVYKLSDTAIYVETGDQTGWIKKELEHHHLYTAANVLVVIEVIGYEGSGRKQGGLFFSEGAGSKNPDRNFGEGYSWDFTFIPMAAFFELRMK